MYLSPPSFLLQRDCAKPISFLAFRIPQIDHSINQCEIGSFLTTSQSTKQHSHRNGYGEKMFGNKPFNDLTMVRNLKSLLMKIGDESIFFSLGFLSQNSLWKLSFVGKKGIYTEMRMECEESGFSKTGLTYGLTESRVLVTR